MTKESGIYRIYCNSNGHFYYGRTRNLRSRRNDHLKLLRRGKHQNQRLQNCFDKYGEDSLVFELVASLPLDEQEAFEQELIDRYIDQPNCMNLNRSASVYCDVPWTDERRAKISAKAKGRTVVPHYSDEEIERRRQFMLGKRHSKETRNKIRNKALGRSVSDETKAKLSQRFSGINNPRFGVNGANAPASKAVAQLDPQTLEILKVFNSLVEAAKAFGADDGSFLGKAARGLYPKAYGFKWKYIESVEIIPKGSRVDD